MAEFVTIAAWVEFVNQEAREMASLGNLPRAALRGHLADRLAEAFAHPYLLEAKCLVVGERDVAAASEGPVVLQGSTRCLELVPEGITREAAALTGPLLAATPRDLHPGSVLRVRFRMDDPRRRSLAVPGIVGELVDYEVDVPVEP